MDMFFEEFIVHEEGMTPKCLGTRTQQGNPENRVLGFYGKKEFTLTAPIELRRGHKMVTVRASVKRPIHVRTMLQRLEGRRD